MTTEGKIKQKINKLLDGHAYNIYRFMPVPTGYGNLTLDYLLCAYSRFVAIEAKRPGLEPTKLQSITMAKIEAAGGIAICVDGDAALAELAKLLRRLKIQHEFNRIRSEQADPAADD